MVLRNWGSGTCFRYSNKISAKGDGRGPGNSAQAMSQAVTDKKATDEGERCVDSWIVANYRREKGRDAKN